MTQEQFSGIERAENERLIISLNEEGNFKVYSSAYPTKSYTVSGTEEGPRCTCPDFEGHKNDPDWKCNHMLAVINLLNKSNEPAAAQNKEPETMSEETIAEAIRGLEVNIKRSVSRDGKINSLSITLSYPVETSAEGQRKHQKNDQRSLGGHRAVQAREWQSPGGAKHTTE
jgi:hypothetical protein